MVVSASPEELPRGTPKELHHDMAARVSESTLRGHVEARLATYRSEEHGQCWRPRTCGDEGNRAPHHQRLSPIPHRQSKRPPVCGYQAAKQTQFSDTTDGVMVKPSPFHVDASEETSMDQTIIDLYDEYTHAPLERRVFLARLAQLTGSMASALALVPLLEANQARAALVALEDQRLETSRTTYAGASGDIK